MSVILYEDGDFEQKGRTLHVTNGQMRAVLEAVGLPEESGPQGLTGILSPQQVASAIEVVKALDRLPGATAESGRKIRDAALAFLEAMEGKSVVYS